MLVLREAKFGQAPKGERLERIKNSPNYRDGEFRNLHNTPVISSDDGMFKVMLDFLFKKKVRLAPAEDLPVVKTDIKALNTDEDVLIWFGHSSYFMRIQGRTFLIDPVLSDYASPFYFINKAFKGTSVFGVKDLPDIDYLIISHDHYDHLDYNTIRELQDKVDQVVCPLGIGQDFEYWGYAPDRITELDWYDEFPMEAGWKITATPARHYSGRGTKRNQTFWASYVLQTPALKLYLGGDSGYDVHFAEIGKKYGPFDLAILEQGQYDERWSLIHLLPSQLFKVAEELGAKRLFPVHNSRFALASHPWDEPLEEVTARQAEAGIPVLTPKIGEPVFLNDTTQTFEAWWKGLE